ncbi:MAG: tetratricopeptide repeat protein [Candidatus Omnitrophica bacterium]|nr:tetratricopeptide repeat protein [Candidatus Omnitrophota bacterium]
MSSAVVLLLGFLSMGAQMKPGQLLMEESVLYQLEGREFQEGGDLRSALSSYQRAIATNPGFADAYNDLGVVLESLGDFQRAEAAYTAALQLDPDLAEAHSNLALLYEQMGRLKEAAAHWRARVQRGPADDPWAVKAEQKLVQHRLSLPAEVRPALKEAPPRASAQRPALKEAPPRAPARQEGRVVPRPQGVPVGLPPAAAAQRAAEQRAFEAEKLEAARKAAEIRKLEEARRAEEARKVRQAREAEEAARRLAQKRAQEEARQAEEAKRRLVQQQAARRVQVERPVATPVPPEPSQAQRPALEEAPPRASAQRIADEFAREKVKALGPAVQVHSSRELAGRLAREKQQIRLQAVKEICRRGLAAMRQGRYEEAATDYQQALLLAPDHPEAVQGLKRARTALAKSKKPRPTAGLLWMKT